MKNLVTGDLVEVFVNGVWEKRIFFKNDKNDSIYCITEYDVEDFLECKSFITELFKKDKWRPFNEAKCVRIACNNPLHDCNNCLENLEVQDKLNLLKKQNNKSYFGEGILNKLKCFLGNNEILIKHEIIIQAINLYEEYEKRINYYKRIQMSYNEVKSCINISIYKDNDEYICFKFNNKGIKYHKGIFINDLNYHQDFQKVSDFSDILEKFENLDITKY